MEPEQMYQEVMRSIDEARRHGCVPTAIYMTCDDIRKMAPALFLHIHSQFRTGDTAALLNGVALIADDNHAG